MATLERRLEALEAASPDSVPVTVIFLSFMRVGGLDEEAWSASIGPSEARTYRDADEPERAFLDRVKAIATAQLTPQRNVALVCLYPAPATEGATQ